MLVFIDGDAKSKQSDNNIHYCGKELEFDLVSSFPQNIIISLEIYCLLSNNSHPYLLDVVNIK